MIGQILRRIAALTLRAVLMRPRTSVAIAVVLALALWSVWTLAAPASSVGAPSTSRQSASAPPPRNEVQRSTGGIAPVPAVESYLQGMTEFDAKLMWDALNEDALRQMQSQGGSLEQLQESLDRTKQSGISYDEVAFIGGYQRRDGIRYLFYVISRRGMGAPNEVEQVWFVFTVDPSGKIAKID